MNAFRDDAGHYTWEGTKLPSVTTILSGFGSEHLMMWYAKMAAEDCANILARAEEDPNLWDDACADIKNVAQRMTAAIRYRDHKGFIGRITHHVIYRYALGDRGFSDEVLEDIAQQLYRIEPTEHANWDDYKTQLVKESRHYVRSALKWIETDKPEFESIGLEATTISLTYGYAGTMDAIAVLNGRRMLMDFKTSNQLSDKVQFQMEAYRRADFIGVLATGEKYDIPETAATAAVHITPMEGCKVSVWEPNDEIYEGFLSARHLYGLLHNMPKPNHKNRAAAPKKLTAREKTCPF